MDALAVRSICYMVEENSQAPLPADQARDGNDLQATHLVTYLGQEPIGSARIRWFRDFAKIERTAFRPGYRHPRYIKFAANFAFSHIARKGYSKVITHGTAEYCLLWQRLLGFRPVNKPAAHYLGHDYFEVVKDLDVPDNGLSLDSSIEELFRVEGAWDAPSKYEGS
jgi:hypothetical protein